MKKRSEIERHKNDYYRSTAYCTTALLSVETIPDFVWEPACGDGAISRVLEREGRRVMSSDLMARGYGTPDINFLDVRVPWPQLGEGKPFAIITNPPFKLSVDFVRHALAFRPAKVCMLLRLSWLEGRKRLDNLFAANPPSRVWVFSDRVTMWHGDDPAAQTEGGATPYAWFVWDAAATNEKPVIDWITKDRHPDALEDHMGALEAAVVVLRAGLRHAIEAAA